MYYDCELQKLSYILGEVDDSLNEFNLQLRAFKNQFNNKDSIENIAKESSIPKLWKVSSGNNTDKVKKVRINQNAYTKLPIQKDKDAAIKKEFTFQHDEQPDTDVENFMKYHASDINKT